MKLVVMISVLLNLVFLTLGIWSVKRMGGWKYLLYRINHNGVAATYEHRKNLFETMPIDENSIVFLGNSLTAYCEWAELLGNPAIKNRGIAGDGTEGVLNRLPSILDGKPEGIFLMIGVNDLLFIHPNNILKNYRKIVEMIHERSPRTKLYLQSILPVNPQIQSIPIDNSDILKVNEGIAQLAEEFDDVFINLHPKFCDEKGFLDQRHTADGIHLDASGYAIWKDALKEYLME